MDRTTGSALVQARRLVEEVGVRVVIGPTYASEELALQEYARRHPGIAFVNGVASAQLSGSPANFFVFDPNAVDFMAGLGTYAYRTLGWRRAVTVTDGADGLFNWAQTAGFVAEFCAQGGTIVKRLWVPPGTQDYSGVIAQIPRDVDGIAALASGPQTVVALAGEVPGLRGNLARRLVLGSIAGGPQLAPFGQQMGDVLQGGSFLATPGAAGRRYLAELHRAFPHLPIGGSAFDIYYHDAMAATVAALAAADGDLSGGERRFMAALAKVRLKSPTGPIRLDRDRQAIGPNYLLRLDGRLYRSVDGVERTFGGYFTGHDPPPGEATPVCKRRTPPPWVR
jgi:branched-chain amino acid transport system substrate-binding protein